jgi:hypothetical protein
MGCSRTIAALPDLLITSLKNWMGSLPIILAEAFPVKLMILFPVVKFPKFARSVF